jgi:hypothetical protein
MANLAWVATDDSLEALDVDMEDFTTPSLDHDNAEMDIAATAIRNLWGLGTCLAEAALNAYESDSKNDSKNNNEHEGQAEDDKIDLFREYDSEGEDFSNDAEINEDFKHELAEFGELNWWGHCILLTFY